MKTLIQSIVVLSLLSLFQAELNAQTVQDTTQLWRVETVDGNNYVGYILDQNAERILLRTEILGDVAIPKLRISILEPVKEEQIKAGEYWYSGLHNSRYFFAPNGFGLDAGKGYYQNIMLFFNQVSVGVTDNISIGFGTVPFFISEGFSLPIWLTPKVSIPIKEDSWNIGVGGLFATVIGESADWVGIAYGVSTWGSPDKNFTAGLGYGFVGNDWARTPAVTLGGMIRTGRRGYFITENYFLDTGNELSLIISAGGRYGNKVTLDYGGMMFISSGGFVILPWVGVVVPFGKKTPSPR